MLARRALLVIASLGLLLGVVACATYRDDLLRGQRFYEESEYEKALAIWRNLERDVKSLRDEDQAKYAYLRGMTDFRLEFRNDARYWLGIAQAREKLHPGSLPDPWEERMTAALDVLNREVWGLAPGEAVGKSDGPSSSAIEIVHAPASSATPAEPPPDAECKSDRECPDGMSCENWRCF